MESEAEDVKRHWQARKRGPCRLALGERLVNGDIHQVLACGHTIPPILDKDALWVHEARDCRECLEELRSGERHDDVLSEEAIRMALILVEDEMTDEDKDEAVHRARHWFTIRRQSKVQTT